MTTLQPRGHKAWTDWLIDRMDGWPLPLWATLTVLILVAILLVHAVEWAFGALAPGDFDFFRATFPVYPFGILGLLAAQRRVSVAALERFRPAAGLDDRQFETTKQQLIRQPARIVLAATLVFGTLGLLIEATRDGAGVRMAEFPVAHSFEVVAAFAGYMFAGPWIVSVFRLLRSVDRLHREAETVDLLNPDPVRAFSSATAFVGLSLIGIVTLSALTDPITFSTRGGLVLNLLLIALAFASFFLPLLGMHRRMQAERILRLDAVGERIDATVARLYALVDDDRPGSTELRDRMLALVATRDMLVQQSTWPWRPETLRWLISALFIPVLLWGITRFLEASVL